MIGWAGQWTQTPSTTPLQLKTWNACFYITFNIWCWPGCSMDSNPICHPLPPKKWNAHFWITFNFWWLAGLVDGLKPQPPPLFSQKMKSSFLDYIQLLMIGQAGQWTRTPSATPLQPKKWNAHFWITFTLDDWPGWSMDSNPIHHPSPANKMKCFFLDYVHYWWSARLVNGLKPHLPPLSSQKKWNAHFWIMFNFWWLAGLVDGLEPHPPPLSTQKNEMLIFGLCSTSDDWLSCSIDLNPIHHPSPPKNMKCLSLYNIQHLMLARLVKGLKPHLPPSLAKKWNVHFWIMFNFWWLAGLVDGFKPHPPPLSSQKREMLIFGLHSTSDNQLGWSMDSNPIHHPSPAKMWNAHYWITINFW